MNKLYPIVISVILFLGTSIITSIGSPTMKPSGDITLPPSFSVNMSFRDAIQSRCSVRTFTDDPIGDDILSTILWTAYGYRDDGSRTILGINDHSSIIYVFREDGTYTYNPFNHSLMLFSEEDLRNTVNPNHHAPIQLGLVWNQSMNREGNISVIEMGAIGQNIYFITKALGLGTVTAAQADFDKIGLPDNQIGRIIMPIGYPDEPPILEYYPNLISTFPRLQNSTVNITTVIKNRIEEESYTGDVSKQELSQLIWASYGYSYFIDITHSSTNHVERHRTVPSAVSVYPLDMYIITESAIFRYVPHILNLNPYSPNPLYNPNWKFPIISFLFPIRLGDYRAEIAQASSQPGIDSAPLIIIPVLSTTTLYSQWYWYFEAGASSHNVMLEATLLDLHAGIEKPDDLTLIQSTLRLRRNSLPIIIIPVGE